MYCSEIVRLKSIVFFLAEDLRASATLAVQFSL